MDVRLSATRDMAYPLIASFLTYEEWTMGIELDVANRQVSAMSCNRRSPCQIVFTPGSPSRLCPMNPPSWAIQRTQVCKVGGVEGGKVV